MPRCAAETSRVTGRGGTADAFARGVAEFNRGEFFASHESWEAIWLGAPEPEKTFLQGITQVAAAFHHHTRGNLDGAASLLRRGLEKLDRFPAAFRGIRLDALRSTAKEWLAMLSGAQPTPAAYPQIKWAETKPR